MPPSASCGWPGATVRIRLEAACLRGLRIGASTYGSIASILKNGLDKTFHADLTPTAEPIRRGNIRGRGYYH